MEKGFRHLDPCRADPTPIDEHVPLLDIWSTGFLSIINIILISHHHQINTPPREKPHNHATHLQVLIKMSQVPRLLRACLVCSFVQAYSRWIKHGCPNCEHFLEMRNSSDVVQDCTSEVFEGVIEVTDTNVSWVAKWQRLEGYVPGIYAVKVNGVVSIFLVVLREGEAGRLGSELTMGTVVG
jgi:transcription elongation factor SPT4